MARLGHGERVCWPAGLESRCSSNMTRPRATRRFPAPIDRVQSLIRFTRFDELVDLDLVELPNALHSADVPSGRGFLAPKAGTVCHVVQGKDRSVENLVAMQVGKGNLRGREEPVVLFGVVKDILAKLR